MNPANDDKPHRGTPGIVGAPPAPPRLAPTRYMGLLAIQIAMVLVVAAIAGVICRVW